MPQKTNITDATATPTDTDTINTDTTNADTSNGKSNAVDTKTNEIASNVNKKKKKDNLLVRFLKFLRTAIIYLVMLFVVGALIFMLFIDNVEAQAWFSRATGGYLDGIATFLNSLF